MKIDLQLQYYSFINWYLERIQDVYYMKQIDYFSFFSSKKIKYWIAF